MTPIASPTPIDLYPSGNGQPVAETKTKASKKTYCSFPQNCKLDGNKKPAPATLLSLS